MPDQYGFNHLADDVRCIDCPAGGALGCWPEHKRAQHAHTHGRTARPIDLRRPRPTPRRLAAHRQRGEGGHHGNHDEAGRVREAGRDRRAAKAGEPLHAKEIAKRVLASGRCAGLKGKTPEATISAMLAVGSKRGGPFTRVDKGTYALADSSAKPAQAKSTQAKLTAKRTAAPKSASSTKSTTAKRTPVKRSR